MPPAIPSRAACCFRQPAPPGEHSSTAIGQGLSPMWIVILALRRPYTFVVMALLILILGAVAIRNTPTDIFPKIDIPVVSIIWQYSGLPPAQMEKYITTFSEYTVSSGVNDVQRIESQTVNGAAVIKIFFQPSVDIGSAVSQVTALSQTILRRMPQGTVPPLIIQYDAASVPVLQLALASTKLSESQLYDFGIYRVRQAIAPVRGSRLPLPYGGKPRQIMVDLNPQALLAKGVTAVEVNNALGAANLSLPTGSAKIGDKDYIVAMNMNPENIAALNDVPIKVVNGSMIYVRDVANVRDGFGVQTNIVRNDGHRAALLTVLKSGNASTLDVVQGIKDALPALRLTYPDIEIGEMFDQSVFVKAAVDGVVSEGLVAALLTATMILLFLGSWRGTLIVTVSIPLSILTSICVLSLTGQTLNIMTLGGLALAVGILVDDATVEVENIHRQLALGKPIEQAILDGARQIAVPTFVATLAICIVFVSVVFLTGPAKFLFTPLALAVVYAMLASWFLSRTLVPVMARFLLKAHEHDLAGHGRFARFHAGFEHGFERLRDRYMRVLSAALHNRLAVFLLFGVVGIASIAVVPFVGRDFFPQVDAGQIRMHVSAPPGTRLEEAELIFGRVDDAIREIIPASDLALLSDNIGLPQPVNLAFTDTPTISSADGEILMSLKPEHKTPTPEVVQRLRTELSRRFPELTFFFQPADIVNQILNFGLPAPIDLQIAGYNPKIYGIARELEQKVKAIPGSVDVHLHQIMNAPALQVNVDRMRAGELGLTQRDIANNVLIALSSSSVINYNLWPDPKTGVTYPIAVQTPQHLLDSIDSLMTTQLPGSGSVSAQLLSNLATLERKEVPAIVSHYDIQPVFDIYANVQNTDLGTVSDQIDKVMAEYLPPQLPLWKRALCPAQPGKLTSWACAPPEAAKGPDGKPVEPKLPPGTKLTVRGQVESMNTAFMRICYGMLFAALLVYLLMVVNFQSWTDPLIIVTALPGALCGIAWMLFLTHTTFSVPSLMGSIMSLGVATANSILIVTFANEQMREGKAPLEAALEAGYIRLRPVTMTALAMIIGMVPMALGLGEGGEQNAPLGRAVIGGLIVATISTLLFVPVVFTIVHERARKLAATQTSVGGIAPA
jgi:multidrug efflux pump subunit AcrB